MHPSTTATVVRVRDGATLTSDGPYATTPEQIGGWYVVDVDTLDDAIDAAARVPGARHGAVEVRPVFEVEPPGRRWPVNAGE